MAHTIDEDTKKIVKAIVHGDQKRQSRRRAGKHTDFDRKAAEAIKAAKKELPLEGTDPEVRRHIIDKLYTSLLYNTPWELLYHCEPWKHRHDRRCTVCYQFRLWSSHRHADKGDRLLHGIRTVKQLRNGDLFRH